MAAWARTSGATGGGAGGGAGCLAAHDPKIVTDASTSKPLRHRMPDFGKRALIAWNPPRFRAENHAPQSAWHRRTWAFSG